MSADWLDLMLNRLRCGFMWPTEEYGKIHQHSLDLYVNMYHLSMCVRICVCVCVHACVCADILTAFGHVPVLAASSQDRTASAA